MVAEHEVEVDEESGPYHYSEQVLRDTLHVKHWGKTKTQIFACFVAYLAAMSFGNALGWTSPIMYHQIGAWNANGTVELVEEEDDTAVDASPTSMAFMISMVPLGCSFGIIKCNLIMKNVGPKKALQIQAPLFILVWWLMLINSVPVKLIGRFILGVLSTTYFISGECLLKQTVHMDLVKYVGAGFNSAVLLGVLVVYIFGYLMDSFWLTLWCSLTPLLHFLMLFLIPESPVYLYEKNRTAALNSLAWYRGKDNVYIDMKMIRDHWETLRIDPETFKYMLYSKVVYKGLLIILGVTVCKVFSGYYIFLFFSIHVWINNYTLIDDKIDVAVIALSFFISRLFWGIIHAKHTNWRVKKILILSCAIAGTKLIILATFIFYAENDDSIMATMYLTPLISVAIIIFAIDMGPNYCVPLLIINYMPIQVFSKVLTIVQVAFWLFVFVNTCSTAWFIQNTMSKYVFATLGVSLLFGAVYCAYYVVEPAGKSLIQIQIELGGNPVGNRGTHSTRMIFANQANLL